MERAGIFDEEFDVSGFSVKPRPAPAAPPEAVRKVSEGSAFRSREPEHKLPPREPRRYRTGRNVQLNVKVRSETLSAFYALADEQGWVLGETLEKAVEALRRELST